VAHPVHRLVEALLLDGLQQVVDRVHFEGVDGVLVVGGDKHHPGAAEPAWSSRLATSKPVSPGIWMSRNATCGTSALMTSRAPTPFSAWPTTLTPSSWPEEEAQFLASGLLIVGDDRAELEAHERPAPPAPRSGSSRRATVAAAGLAREMQAGMVAVDDAEALAHVAEADPAAGAVSALEHLVEPLAGHTQTIIFHFDDRPSVLAPAAQGDAAAADLRRNACLMEFSTSG